MGFYRAATATPLRPRDVYTGYLAWLGLHAMVHAVAYLVVATLLGGVSSPWAALAVPVAALCAMAFAAPLAAYAVAQDSDVHFAAIMRLVVLPLFLFSGSFFPVDDLPSSLHPVARIIPLWHAVELCRDLTTGRVGLGADAVHLLVLVGCIVLGTACGVHTFTRRLAS
jgi:lipooligosaccharide transport system permease protein